MFFNIEDQSNGEILACDIQFALKQKFYDHKYFLFNSYIFDWESDYLSINESKYIYECEIKISRNDFGKDFHKKDKHLLLETKSNPDKLPNKFFYAFPRGLINSYDVPEYAGMIEIRKNATGYEAEIIKNAPFLHREKLFDGIQPALLEKFYHKYIRTETENYAMVKQIAELNEKIKKLK